MFSTLENDAMDAYFMAHGVNSYADLERHAQDVADNALMAAAIKEVAEYDIDAQIDDALAIKATYNHSDWEQRLDDEREARETDI